MQILISNVIGSVYYASKHFVLQSFYDFQINSFGTAVELYIVRPSVLGPASELNEFLSTVSFEFLYLQDV